MTLALRYCAIGALLGAGAPAGALLLRIHGGAGVAEELRNNTFFYAYQLIGTSGRSSTPPVSVSRSRS